MSRNTKPALSIDPDIWKEVDEYAAAAGLKTANTLMAAAAVEFAKAKRKGLNVWHVLGRIAADEENDRTEVQKRLRGPTDALPVAR